MQSPTCSNNRLEIKNKKQDGTYKPFCFFVCLTFCLFTLELIRKSRTYLIEYQMFKTFRSIRGDFSFLSICVISSLMNVCQMICNNIPLNAAGLFAYRLGCSFLNRANSLISISLVSKDNAYSSTSECSYASFFIFLGTYLRSRNSDATISITMTAESIDEFIIL